MSTESYWMDDVAMPKFGKVEKKLKVDVIVVGAGMTGITAAYLLKRAGVKVALLEQHEVVAGDSQSTTAHLTCVTDTLLSELVRTFGRDHAAAVWDAGSAAIDMIEHNVKELDIKCRFQRVPGYLHGSIDKAPEEQRGQAEEEARLAAELGFEAGFVEEVPIFGRPGMRIANQGIFNPLLYFRGLLEAIEGRGSHVFEHSEVTEFKDNPRCVMVNGHAVEYEEAVLATHVPLQGNNDTLSATWMQSKIAPYSSYVVGAKLPKGTLPAACWWDMSSPYYYLRIDPRRDYDYVIWGGGDHKTGQALDTESIYDKLEAALKRFVPVAQFANRWTGQVITTNDGLPYIGRYGNHQVICTGYEGEGMTFGTVAGMMACDIITGRKNPWEGLFDPRRTKVMGGAWDYIKENLDYPYYMIKDRLRQPEGTSADAVKPGEGKILMIDGQRVAAHRDEKGELHEVSAVCTHMGCIVHWNAAEKTWDCPCHGSRFKPDGDVLAGPAESALGQVREHA